MNSISGFELIKNLNNTFLAKCTDFSTIHAKSFLFPRLCMQGVYTLLGSSFIYSGKALISVEFI